MNKMTIGSFCPMIEAICGMSCGDLIFGKPCSIQEEYYKISTEIMLGYKEEECPDCGDGGCSKCIPF